MFHKHMSSLFYRFIRTDMLATCRIPCPLHTASVNLILTNEFKLLRFFDIIFVILIYARICWPCAVCHVRCPFRIIVGDVKMMPSMCYKTNIMRILRYTIFTEK